MLAAALISVLTAAVYGAHASSAGGGAIPDPSSMLLTLFQACRTGVLRVHKSDAELIEWLDHFRILPTSESVDRIGRLLLGDSVYASCSQPEEGATMNSRSALLDLLVRRLCYYFSTDNDSEHPPTFLEKALQYVSGVKDGCLTDFVVKYAVFKAVMRGGLSRREAKALGTINSRLHIRSPYNNGLERLIASLADMRCNGDLFAALVNSHKVFGVCDALSDLSVKCPAVVNKLVTDYIKSGRKCAQHIPRDLFMSLDSQSQYDLLRVGALLWLRPKKLSWNSLYVLSGFSGLPSDYIKRLCLEKRPEYQIYEEEAHEVEGNLVVAMDCFDPETIPKEVWVTVLLYCDNLLFQIYTVPMVCKYWMHLHHILLSRSLTIQQRFVTELANGPKMYKALDGGRYPWNYFLKSPHSFLKYSLLCLENFQRSTSQTNNWIRTGWKRFAQKVGETEPPVPPASYMALYVRCCKLVEGRLKFYLPPEMSNEAYIALVRDLVGKHGITPAVPTNLLTGDCDVFVQMMTDNSDLVTLLLEDAPWHCEKLAIYLFLNRPDISPALDEVFGRLSAAYRVLMDENSSIKELLKIILQLGLEEVDEQSLARCIVRLCLTRGLQSDPKVLRKLGKKIVTGYGTRYGGDDFACSPSFFRRQMKRKLASMVVRFLCDNCQDYSEKEFWIVEQVLKECGVFIGCVGSYAFMEYVANHLDVLNVDVVLD